jgi:hypothetical protein
MNENDKGCGTEGHVCVCGDTSVPADFTMSLEDWLLDRLQMAKEQLQDDRCDAMLEMLTGGLITLITCLKHVKISAKHDEISTVLKETIVVLHKNSPDGAGFILMEGLIVLKKLEAEKKNEIFDWDYTENLGPDDPFLQKELKRVLDLDL